MERKWLQILVWLLTALSLRSDVLGLPVASWILETVFQITNSCFRIVYIKYLLSSKYRHYHTTNSRDAKLQIYTKHVRSFQHHLKRKPKLLVHTNLCHLGLRAASLTIVAWRDAHHLLATCHTKCLRHLLMHWVYCSYVKSYVHFSNETLPICNSEIDIFCVTVTTGTLISKSNPFFRFCIDIVLRCIINVCSCFQFYAALIGVGHALRKWIAHVDFCEFVWNEK